MNQKRSSSSNLPAEFAPIDVPHDPQFLRGGTGAMLPRRRRRIGQRVAIALTLIAAAAGLMQLVKFRTGGDSRNDPRFTLREIRIEGIGSSRRAALESTLAPLIGQNLFSFDLSAVRSQTEGLAWIESAAIAKQLPSTLVVRVREKNPVALCLKDGRLWYLAGDGRFIGPFGAGAEDVDLPVATGTSDPAELARIGAFLTENGGKHPELIRRVSEIRAGEEGSLIVYDPSAGCDVIVDPEGFSRSFPRWLSLWPEISRRFGEIESADLRFENRIVLRPAPRTNA